MTRRLRMNFFFQVVCHPDISRIIFEACRKDAIVPCSMFIKEASFISTSPIMFVSKLFYEFYREMVATLGLVRVSFLNHRNLPFMHCVMMPRTHDCQEEEKLTGLHLPYSWFVSVSTEAIDFKRLVPLPTTRLWTNVLRSGQLDMRDFHLDLKLIFDDYFDDSTSLHDVDDWCFYASLPTLHEFEILLVNYNLIFQQLQRCTTQYNAIVRRRRQRRFQTMFSAMF